MAVSAKFAQRYWIYPVRLINIIFLSELRGPFGDNHLLRGMIFAGWVICWMRNGKGPLFMALNFRPEQDPADL